MIKRSYSLQLATPAFLGGADQRAEWRTPPFKALIREWWRIAVAPEVGFSFSRLKERETELFGTAADEGGGENHKSLIRLALKHWHSGSLREHSPLPKIHHPEAEKAKHQVEPLNYLGYGPIDKGRFKHGAALQDGDSNILSLAFRDIDNPGLNRALNLINWFGTIGGRSRNGWGSLLLQAGKDEPALPFLSPENLMESHCVRPLAACLQNDWPHAIGSDGEGLLIWHSTESFATWRDAMRFLAQVKIGFRVSLKLIGGQPHRLPQERHVLAYPVTNHKVSPWEGPDRGRLASTLRFKLAVGADKRLVARIFHTPCRPTLPHDGIDLLGTWQIVHKHLDAHPQLTRMS